MAGESTTAERKEELRIHALGAAISRREWWEVEQAHAAIRDEFHARQRASISPSPEALPSQTSGAEVVARVKSIRPMDCEAVIDFLPGLNGALPFDIGSPLALAKPASEPAGGGVTVKPLKWKRRRRSSDDFYVETDMGEYCAGLVHSNYVAIRRSIRDAQLHDEVLQRGLGLEDAKAVAQADYEARILSALCSPASSSPAEWVKFGPSEDGIKAKAKRQARLEAGALPAGVDGATQIALGHFATTTARAQAIADDIREQGWAVAVHNDYRLNGEAHTFWLFTKGDRAIKGEGRTDADALNAVRRAIAASAPAQEDGA